MTRRMSIDGNRVVWGDTALNAEVPEVMIGGAPSAEFEASASFTRPADTTAYSTGDVIGSDLVVTGLAYTDLVVTLTSAAHGLVAGDRITVAGVDAGFSVTNVDGDWTITSVTTNAITFTVAVQPTGDTPQTVTAGTIRKHLRWAVAREAGRGVLICRAAIACQGVAMTGAMRLVLYSVRQSLLADNGAYTLLQAGVAGRKAIIDITPVTEGSGSDSTFGESDTPVYVKCDTADTYLYGVLVAEAASTPVSSGVITVTLAGLQN